jgi:Mg2+-importing ATPase
MFAFGLLSSVFDYLTFGVLLFVLRATQDQFRTGWFLESVISGSLVVLVIRSRKPFFKKQAGEVSADDDSGEPTCGRRIISSLPRQVVMSA